MEELGQIRAKVDEIDHAVTNDLKTESGMIFLQVKNHALLNYTKMELFFSLLKLESPDTVHNHPVFKELVRYRTLLERVRPLDRKMKYQIDKMLKVALSDGQEVDESLNYAPNPDQLVTNDGQLNGAAGDDDDDDDGDAGERTGAAKDGIYRAPRLAAVHYEEEEREHAKKAKREERNKKRMQKSTILSELREEFSERPEEIHTSGTTALDKEIARDEAERKEFEESRFVRVVTSRKDKIKKRMREREAMTAESVGDIDNFAGIQDVLGLDKSKHRIPKSYESKKSNGKTGGIFAHIDAPVDNSKRRKVSKSAGASGFAGAMAASGLKSSSSAATTTTSSSKAAPAGGKKKKVVFSSIF
ncbi:TPA: hypothetical protein N0F65_012655 [Lagenidium giganteum]|uniref:Neuroguidin n=1 Tax=Lagenidium giganteum TaxID=4803 RepID=A0AAV2YMA3_9STRA|nr:TPA: hypothetical protein N0F65_012655 [Lagenidium giganteum]